MDLHDRANVRRVIRQMSRDQRLPEWAVIRTIENAIAAAWDRSRSDPEAAALWEKYFPGGEKPTPEEYICRLGHAHERGEYVPELLSYGE